MILYTVKFKRKWVQLTGVSDTHPDGTGWTLTNKFNRNCILNKVQAEVFKKPNYDPRYKIVKYKMQLYGVK